MKTYEKQFVELIRQSLTKDYKELNIASDDWIEILKLCEKGYLIAVTYPAVSKQSSIPADMLKHWHDYSLMITLNQMTNWRGTSAIISGFEEQGIRYLLFKGEIVASLYPTRYTRLSSDSDIFVEQSDMPKVHEIMEKLGYVFLPDKDHSNPMVSYFSHRNGHAVEVHNCLYEDYTGPQIDLLNSFGFEKEETSISVNIDGKDVKTLGHENHLVFLIFHTIKHFLLEGMRVRTFIDIMLFVEKYGSEMDREKFWVMIERLGYGTFTEMFFEICIRYFGMSNYIVNGRSYKYTNEDLETLLLDFVYVGDAENKRQKGWQLTEILSPYLVGEKKNLKENGQGRALQFLFPSVKELDPHYGYAKKCPILLPIAWIHRAIRNSLIFRKEKGNKYSMKERVEAVNSRLTLVKMTKLDK